MPTSSLDDCRVTRSQREGLWHGEKFYTHQPVEWPEKNNLAYRVGFYGAFLSKTLGTAARNRSPWCTFIRRLSLSNAQPTSFTIFDHIASDRSLLLDISQNHNRSPRSWWPLKLKLTIKSFKTSEMKTPKQIADNARFPWYLELLFLNLNPVGTISIQFQGMVNCNRLISDLMPRKTCVTTKCLLPCPVYSLIFIHYFGGFCMKF